MRSAPTATKTASPNQPSPRFSSRYPAIAPASAISAKVRTPAPSSLPLARSRSSPISMPRPSATANRRARGSSIFRLAPSLEHLLLDQGKHPLGLLDDLGGGTDQQWIGNTGDLEILVRVLEQREEVAEAVDARPFLVIGLDHHPRRIARVGVEKHRCLGLSVIVPAVERADVERGEFPLLERIVAARDETPHLLLPADREPVLDQAHPPIYQHAL